jgi:hypothetical protein
MNDPTPERALQDIAPRLRAMGVQLRRYVGGLRGGLLGADGCVEGA